MKRIDRIRRNIEMQGFTGLDDPRVSVWPFTPMR
jgi:hypothetical protein